MPTLEALGPGGPEAIAAVAASALVERWVVLLAALALAGALLAAMVSRTAWGDAV